MRESKKVVCARCDHQHVTDERVLGKDQGDFCYGLYLIGGSGHYSEAWKAVGATGRGGDYAKARYFGVMEPEGRGRWALTEKGRKWVMGEIEIPHKVEVRDSVARTDPYGEPRSITAARNADDSTPKRADEI